MAGSDSIPVVVHTRRDYDPVCPDTRVHGSGVTVHHVDAAGPPRSVSRTRICLPYMDAFARELTQVLAAVTSPTSFTPFMDWSGHAALRAGCPRGCRLPTTFTRSGLKRRYQGDGDTSTAERLDLERAVIRAADQIVATCTDEVFELIRLCASNPTSRSSPAAWTSSSLALKAHSKPRRAACAGWCPWAALVEAQGVRKRDLRLEQTCPTPSWWWPAARPRRAGRRSRLPGLRALAEEEGVADRVELRGELTLDRLRVSFASATPWSPSLVRALRHRFRSKAPWRAGSGGGFRRGGMIDSVVHDSTRAACSAARPGSPGRCSPPFWPIPSAVTASGRAGVQRTTRRLYD